MRASSAQEREHGTLNEHLGESLWGLANRARVATTTVGNTSWRPRWNLVAFLLYPSKSRRPAHHEPTLLRTMPAGLDRFFRDNWKTFSIQNDKEFERSRKILNGKSIELRELGKGKKPRRTHVLKEQEEQLLWDKVFGCHTHQRTSTTLYTIL